MNQQQAAAEAAAAANRETQVRYQAQQCATDQLRAAVNVLRELQMAQPPEAILAVAQIIATNEAALRIKG